MDRQPSGMEAVSCGTAPATPATAQKHKKQHKQQRHVHPLLFVTLAVHSSLHYSQGSAGVALCDHAKYLSCCGATLFSCWLSMLSLLSTALLQMNGVCSHT